MIYGKIAKIIDKYTVVINKGYKDGVEDLMDFIIYDEGEQINDPDTGKSLGKLEIVKGKLEITNVQEKICTAESNEYEEVASGYSGIPSYRSRKILNITVKGVESSVKNMVIKVGDKVRQVEI